MHDPETHCLKDECQGDALRARVLLFSYGSRYGKFTITTNSNTENIQFGIP